MKASEFCYWLQGFFELTDSTEITPDQVEKIKNHLNLVFYHDLDPKQVAQKLQQIHDADSSGRPEPNQNEVWQEEVWQELVRC